jgi:hypothetical protein
MSVTKRCFECSEPASFDHHVIPREVGGRRTVPLCERCMERALGHLEFVELQTVVLRTIAAIAQDAVAVQDVRDQLGVAGVASMDVHAALVSLSKMGAVELLAPGGDVITHVRLSAAQEVH